MNMGAPRRRYAEPCMTAKTKTDQPSVENQLQAALKSLEQMSTKRDLDNLARFGITATRPFGVSMANLKVLAKRVGPHHELAAALWDTDRYEARMLATLIDEPARVTPAQMERWCRDFDNWGICDTACFALFDRTPHAWAKVTEWSDRRGEFAKRASFALLACLALHDKEAADEPFLEGLAADRAGCERRPEFREEGCQLGDPPGGQAQCRAQRRVGHRGPAFVDFGQRVGKVDWEGRPQGADERCGRQQASGSSWNREPYGGGST